MRHYLAMLWDRKDPRAAEDVANFRTAIEQSDQGWACRLQAEGLLVFQLHSQRPGFHAYALPNGTGVILGQLFTRAEEPQAVSPTNPFSRATAESICATGGRELIRDYWGTYVAFLCSPTDARRYVIRDCSGQIPCYTTRCGAVEFVFSDIADLSVLGFTDASIEWTYVAAFIYSNDLQIRNCALGNVTELLAGDCLEWWSTDQRHQYCLWSPSHFIANRIDDYDNAARLLRTTTAKCIDAWASQYSNVIHSLSGGFDSTVVLACLMKAKSRPTVTCVNRYAAQPGEDERYYARLAAERAGAPLIEEEWQALERCFDERVLATPRTAKPSVPLMFGMLEVDGRNAIARQCGASTTTTGQGGDHLFLQISQPVAAADFLSDRGAALPAITLFADSARLARTSIWAVAKSSLAYRYFGKRWQTPAVPKPPGLYVATDALPPSIEDYISHPWSIAARASSPGRQLQAHMLADLVNRHRPLGDLDHAEELHPLISQPLMELCLGIPSYLLLRGGRPRALAREAFANDVPRQICARNDKGTIMSVVLKSLRQSKTFLQELMLNGALVRERIVDRRALDELFSQGRPMRVEQLYPLLSCIAAEVWVRSWKERSAATRAHIVR